MRLTYFQFSSGNTWVKRPYSQTRAQDKVWVVGFAPPYVCYDLTVVRNLFIVETEAARDVAAGVEIVLVLTQ